MKLACKEMEKILFCKSKAKISPKRRGGSKIKKSIDNNYPTRIELFHSVNEGVAQNVMDESILMDTRGAIKLILIVNNCDYPKEQVEKAIKEICQKALEYYC